MKTLKELLVGSFNCGKNWAIYAEKCDGVFRPESLARFGDSSFVNGGMLDACQFFSANEEASYDREAYSCGDASFYEEWAIKFIKETNDEIDGYF